METQSAVHNHLVDTQTEVQDDMGQSDNEYDTLNYESEKYSDDEDENGTNTSDVIQVKRGITRLAKFRVKYGKPGSVKFKVTFDAMSRLSGLHRALFSSFLGDLVREHIGLKVLCWKQVKKESRDKLWDEITVNIYYFLTQYYISLYNHLRYVQLINNIVLTFAAIF